MFHLSKKANAYLQAFYKTKNIENWFACFSIHVWNELKNFHEVPAIYSKVDERELTNSLIRGIAKLIHTDEIALPLRLFHSRNEHTNGSDLEIVIQLSKNKNLIFPCQAKRLYVENSKKNNLNAKYLQLNYKGGNQKKLLIKYAKQVKGFPLYLLYNYSEHDFETNAFYPHKELYGCSLISAYFLDENPPSNPTVPILHPPALPLTSIVKFKNIATLNLLWGKSKIKHNAVLHLDKHIFDNNGWNELAPPAYPQKRFVSDINIKKLLASNNTKIDFEKPFNPRFRIVFTQEEIDCYSRNINFNI